MTRRERNRLREQFRSQVEAERNGAPIPGDIAELMTRPKEPERLFQVGVTVRATGKVAFLGPMMNEDAIRSICADVNKQILAAGRSDWTKAEAYPMTPISDGVH